MGHQQSVSGRVGVRFDGSENVFKPGKFRINFFEKFFPAATDLEALSQQVVVISKGRWGGLEIREADVGVADKRDVVDHTGKGLYRSDRPVPRFEGPNSLHVILGYEDMVGVSSGIASGEGKFGRKKGVQENHPAGSGHFSHFLPRVSQLPLGIWSANVVLVGHKSRI